MMPAAKISQLQSKKQYYANLILQQPFRPLLLNVNLVNNPFLKGQQQYNYILYSLNFYNKRVANSQVTDPYESMSYQRLHSCITDLSMMDKRDDQIYRLGEIFQWAKQQQKLILQRKDQGVIRYKALNKVQEEVKNKILSEKHQEKIQTTNQYEIPSELIYRLMGPYSKHSRTIHKELDIPANLLLQYKRKVINIAPFMDTKEQVKPQRILYPVPPKIQEPIKQQDQDKDKQKEKEAQIKQGEVKQGQLKEGQIKGEEAVADQQQDLGGFGEEPQQPDQDNKAEQEGVGIVPRIKAFTSNVKQPKKRYYRGLYMHYKGEEGESERRMEELYWKSHNQKTMIQKQDEENMRIAEQWGKKKSKIQKQLNKRLENMTLNPNYDFSQEVEPKPEKLSSTDEIKYGFTVPLRNFNERKRSFDMTSVRLPKILGEEFNEKFMRKDRLNSLKNKFGKLLNLTDFQERQTAPSICQYTSRRRGISEIIQNHSKSKERLNQLQQVSKIKQRLTRNKIGINIKALSQGLCLPQQQQTLNGEGNNFPIKMLPSNPFMVQTKKKKKKK